MKRSELLEKLEVRLKKIYGEIYKIEFMNFMEELIKNWENKEWNFCDPLTEKNIYLITYGDSIYEEGKPTLETLNKFLDLHSEGTITDVHLLPMFEYTSDDGFSVVDYKKIDPRLGDWSNIKTLSENYRLMFDFVANHMSKSSDWFKGYLNGEEKYKEYFISEDKSFDASGVVRPRTSPLFHEYEGKNGKKTAWSTFSEDQVDLNVKHYPVLLETIDILLTYAIKGATSIRLDAIGFLWKKSGTTSIHLPETHEIIKLWRDILDYFKENTQVITETNVPHKENISYFGDTTDEAHQVYQFTLPPLVLHSFTTHDTTKLTKWAKTINRVSKDATYFNFLSSHDGIGMRPTEGILTEEEKNKLADKVFENGGKVNYKSNSDGSKSVYELNINYSDALINKGEDLTLDNQVDKILAAHAILFSMVGVPAVYYHSLLGSRNDYKGMEESGINRRINREKLEFSRISEEINSDIRRNKIFNGMKKLIKTRQEEPLFSPYTEQKILDLGDSLFSLERYDELGKKVTFVVNTSLEDVKVDLKEGGVDIITQKKLDKEFTLKSYGYVWIK